MSRRRSFLVVTKIRAGKIRFTIPILLPLLIYFVEMLGELRVYVCWSHLGKFYKMLSTVGETGLLLEELRLEGPLDLVDVEAEDQKDGKVFVKVYLR